MTDGQANTAKNIQEFPPQASGYGMPVHEYEDEISLVDLWLVLVRRKKVIALVVALVVAVGTGFALLKPKAFQYTASLEIGTRLIKDNVRAFEQPETVLAKIREAYIPVVLHQYAKEHPGEGNKLQINAQIPKNSEIIVLEAKGPDEKKQVYLGLLQAIIDKVRKDHSRIDENLRKEIEVKRNEAVNKLAGLQDEAKLLDAKGDRLKDATKLLTRQITETNVLLKDAEKSRRDAVGQVGNEARAMTLLMLDNEVRATRERLDTLEERLHIELASDQDELTKAIADNLRRQSEQRDQISKYDAELLNIRDTRAVVPPMQSLVPVGPRKTVIIALSAVLGIFLGVFVAFFAEFLAKVREQTKETAV